MSHVEENMEELLSVNCVDVWNYEFTLLRSSPSFGEEFGRWERGVAIEGLRTRNQQGTTSGKEQDKLLQYSSPPNYL
jgi:hypothetical protein